MEIERINAYWELKAILDGKGVVVQGNTTYEAAIIFLAKKYCKENEDYFSKEILDLVMNLDIMNVVNQIPIINQQIEKEIFH
jgi:hypothetical protein